MSEKLAFENNQVLLWGLKPVKKSLFEQYDKGNKNPQSITRKKKVNEEPKIKVKKEPVKRVFSLNEDYGIDDLPFLNKEYDRIDEELGKAIDNDEINDLENKQEKLYELIEGLENMKKIQGKGIKPKTIKEHYFEDELVDDDFIGGHLKKLIGKGFKKGSPEAIAHAEKMRKVLEEKNKNKIEKPIKKAITTKSRVEKGSEEAKALGKRLAEAKKKKLEEAKKVKEEIKPVKKGKAWFYIGDIPKGYREATEDEAIIANKVSEYGKHVVDEEKYRLYRDYDVLLTTEKSDQENQWYMNGLKKRIMSSLKEIEILSSKIDNDKYKDKLAENKTKLANEKEKKKYLQAGWNWYYKLYCEKNNIKYERQKFELEKPKINKSNKNYQPIEYKKPVRPIDPRTGKEAEYIEYTGEEEKKKEEHKGDIDVDLYFEKDGDLITLSTKYFTPDYKLKSKYIKKLLDKGITLRKKHYNTDDYNKHFYGIKGGYLLVK